MSPVLVIPAVVVAVAAAVRSTWSPCGWSMLSTITPITERTRGHRFGVTATWFTVGAIVGGAALGLVGAALAWAVRAVGIGLGARLVVAAVAIALAAALDASSSATARFRGVLPHHRRQVNENWLDEFRPWVYASGFGAQIGSGLATYIMTAGVYLVVVLGALTAQPLVAVALGLVFGTARGAAVWTGIANATPAKLGAFHRRFAALADPVRLAIATTYGFCAVGLGLAALDVVPVALPAAIAVLPSIVVVTRAFVRLPTPAQPTGSTVTPASAPLMAATNDVRRINEPTTA